MFEPETTAADVLTDAALGAIAGAAATAAMGPLTSYLSKRQPESAKRLEKDYGYLWTDARKYIRENPGTSVAISLGAGLLLGFLLRGDDD